ncbi:MULTISPECIES: aggregation-promoting factor C-terminal-like domain-containing protein [Staphylococcus]|uniref:aggregation-promoting factor C-terminal-like domain-containing protein n=1 Tax=Staphylococcus TaxID=1279 RepID=UPI00094B859B|nr:MULTISPECIES: transglycosylase [Staphylococcus]MBF2778086.1 transglycosylase [Staphylococcus saprophyticus]MDW3852370.1 transglycosylase [Staphylococcus saprophyticus]MDW4299247.1 transglycosylase [Staphylococcus saprophyticus]MDW4393515.1 transglycosylase [Staphylococcus saprophyticus]MDW4437053.1 transglycosylase [Staphylococcus saprophyticus]
MKKTILASSLAVALGVTGYAATADHNQAHASEENIDQAHLADLAQNNPEQLNEKPLHAGAYNYDFVLGGNEYTFTSDGQTWSWNYTTAGAQSASSNTIQDVTAQATTHTNETSANEVRTQQQSSNTEVAAVEAPKASSNTNVQTAQTSAAVKTYKAAQTSAASTGGSVKAQFLAAGGSEAMWNSIVLPESSGNPNAVNSAGYRGLGQTKESWGTGSVADQTKGMLNYAEQRYGSVDAALSFRALHGWW